MISPNENTINEENLNPPFYGHFHNRMLTKITCDDDQYRDLKKRKKKL